MSENKKKLKLDYNGAQLNAKENLYENLRACARTCMCHCYNKRVVKPISHVVHMQANSRGL
jgi:hypothetical protein